MSSTLYPIYAESESKTCKERGEEFITEKYNTVGYELIHMISNPNHTEDDIELTLCWIVDDQIQVGKLITLYAKASSDRYVMNDSDYKITITFPKELINYWEDPNHTRQFNYTTSNQLILVQNNSMIFESKPINFRFTVPENISIVYCEYFPNEDCFNASSLLRPASYYLDQELNLSRQTLILTEHIKDLTFDFIKLTCFIVFVNIILVVLTITLIIISIPTRYPKKVSISLVVSVYVIAIIILFKFINTYQCLPSYYSF